MGCGSSTTAAPTERTQGNGNTNTNSNTNTNTNYNYNTNTNTNTTGGTSTVYPDDNAIYGYDLYGDDNKKKEGGGGGGSAVDGGGTMGGGGGTNTNEMQYDDAGFYGETEKEKKEIELFDDRNKKDEGGTTETNTVDNKEEEPPTVIDNKETETNKEETSDGGENKVETDVTETEKTEESQPEPEPEPEPKVEETDVTPPAPVDDVTTDTNVTENRDTQPEEPEPTPKEEEVTPPAPAEEDSAGDQEAAREDRTDGGTAITAGDYATTSTGLMAQFHDFRANPEQEENERRPSTTPGELYTEHQFGLYDAITDRATTQNLEWKRPIEISTAPKLFSDGTTRFDIGQGSAGTCWFLSTVANISEHPALLKQVLPDDAYMVEKESYDGVFHARFWRFGKWDDVYIDDYLPIIHGKMPWGARSATDENEFWVSLLEKAFARYHGSYNAVYGGQPGDAYLALTGGVAERIDFEDNDDRPRKLFSRIRNAINSGAHVTCVVPDEFDKVKGLVGGHAYSLTGTAQAKGVSLVRVRNPWGNTEWTGDWSDGSAQWSGVSEQEVPRAVIDDGEFWINLQDFMTYFSQTTICALTPDFDMDGSSDSLNYVSNVYGEWQGQTAAGFRDKLQNPRFLITVPDSEAEAAVVVQLIQRTENRKVQNFQVRCDVYKVLTETGDYAVLEIMGENTNSYSPEAQCSFRHKMTPGTYAIVPSTVEPGQEKSFLIRVFSSCPVGNVREMPRNHKVMSCTQETSFTHEGSTYPLNHCESVHGQWKAGVNSGGQISHRDSHASNPQFIISVTETTPVVLHVVQEQCEPRMPIGLRLYPTGKAPLDIDEIYNLYEDALTTTDGVQSKFVQSWDVDANYMLKPGEYNLILHMDEPDTEKRFALIVKSSSPVTVRGHQTGL